MYDLQYLLRLGLRVNAASHDSMLLHHSIFPEMNKGLGFLGSIYSFEPAWKLMRKHRGDDIGVKADESHHCYALENQYSDTVYSRFRSR